MFFKKNSYTLCMLLWKYFSSKSKIILSMVSITVTLFMVVLFFRLPYMSFTWNVISFTPLALNYNQLDFAWEKVIVDPLYNPLGHEKLEEELLRSHFDLYQILLFHKLSRKYFPFIESYFRSIGVPDDFKYLAVAESGLRLTAESHVGARGLWQLMPDTARRFGLRVDADIDERLHFEKSTKVAWTYLKQMYPLFDDWTLTAAAYNRWESGLQRDIKSQSWQVSYYDLVLNDETGQYVYRIVALKYLMQNIWKLFTAPMLEQIFEMPETKTLLIQGPVLDLRVMSLELGINYQELRELNPWILWYTLPSWPWEVKLFVR